MATVVLGVRFVPAAGGTVDFVYSSTVTGYRGVSALTNGQTYAYRAESADLSQWEWGYGVYTSGTTTLARTTIIASSTGSKINFSAAPQVALTPRVEDVSFDVGTLMLFQQTSAPTGWTKQTTHNDKALRVVSGTASSGGSVAFSTLFGRTATDNVTLGDINMPATSIAVGSSGGSTVKKNVAGTNNGGMQLADPGLSGAGQNFVVAGSGVSFTSSIDMRVNYVDLIIAARD